MKLLNLICDLEKHCVYTKTSLPALPGGSYAIKSANRVYLDSAAPSAAAAFLAALRDVLTYATM